LTAADQPLGRRLKALRRERGLSGEQVADMVGVSQSTISRIETGKILPPPAEAHRIALLLGADPEDADRIAEQAGRLRGAAADWAAGEADMESRQQETEQLEAMATSFQVFQPTVVIGLLQSSGYAEAVISAMQRLTPGDSGGMVDAVSARVHRQRILEDPARRFDFVMTEATLSNRICPPEEMPAQIRRIRLMARRPNVTIGIIPSDVEWRMPPFHGFSILDGRHLLVDLYDTGLSKHDQSDADVYARIFAMMKEQASTDIEPILSRYSRQYAQEIADD
jgi:transcriptional regulator with XRE-family HTH domain